MINVPFAFVKCLKGRWYVSVLHSSVKECTNQTKHPGDWWVFQVFWLKGRRRTECTVGPGQILNRWRYQCIMCLIIRTYLGQTIAKKPTDPFWHLQNTYRKIKALFFCLWDKASWKACLARALLKVTKENHFSPRQTLTRLHRVTTVLWTWWWFCMLVWTVWDCA